MTTKKPRKEIKFRDRNGRLLRREQFGKCWDGRGRCPHVSDEGVCCANDPDDCSEEG